MSDTLMICPVANTPDCHHPGVCIHREPHAPSEFCGTECHWTGAPSECVIFWALAGLTADILVFDELENYGPEQAIDEIGAECP